MLNVVSSREQVIITGPDPRPIEIGVSPRQTGIIHEKAVVIMTYHMINEALKGHSRIGVLSDDTDVFLLPPTNKDKQLTRGYPGVDGDCFW